MAGVFASKELLLEADPRDGGAISGNPRLIGVQFLAAFVTFIWAFGCSFILAKIMDKIPGLSLRMSDEDEEE